MNCTCSICGCTFTTEDRWRGRKACDKKECRSEVNRRASRMRKGIEVHMPIVPIKTAFRTIWQPLP